MDNPNFDENQNSPAPEQPEGASISLRSDSVRLGTVGDRVKCIVVIDVNALTPEQQAEFANKAMAALTRMGEKVMTKKAGRIIKP